MDYRVIVHFESDEVIVRRRIQELLMRAALRRVEETPLTQAEYNALICWLDRHEVIE